MIKNNKATFFVIFVGLILSILFSINGLNKHDKNKTTIDGNSYHQMIKADTFRYLSHGNEIKNQLNEGINFFKTGREHYTKYLPPRLIAAYYYFFDKDLFQNSSKTIINEGIHLNYIIMQCLLYFFSITILFLTLKNIFDKRICFFIFIFLSFEPTIFQYHGTFWSESIFFSFQIILISLILQPKPNMGTFFFIGIFLAVLSLQKEYAIFYIIPVLLFLLFFLKDKKINNFISLGIGFIIVQSVLGFNNYYRSGSFYIMPATTKTDLHMILVTNVVSKKLGIQPNEFEKNEGKAALSWINKNSIELNNKINDKSFNSIESRHLWALRDYIKNEVDKIKLDQFIQKRTINFFAKYPSDFILEVMKNSVHVTLLNPFHIYSDHKYYSGEFYYNTSEHKELIKYRIIYTLIIYLICLYGLYVLIKQKNFKVISYLILSILYFFAPISWHGNTRYFLPCYIYFSIFFGVGLNKLIIKII